MEFAEFTKFTNIEIAKLVLGYLKNEKCFEAYDHFLQTCSHFDNIREKIKMDKLFVTRVVGMCLTDFLDEYATIYCIVQRRLEATNYYNVKRGRSNLVEQLMYLLERSGASEVESSTPIQNVNNRAGARSPKNGMENIYFEANTIDSKTPKRRNISKKHNKGPNEAFDVSEILTQTLLENHELHEKLAETINMVRSTPELAKTITDEHISAGASRELDAIIKTVVQRTEEDPIYNKMLDEIIGTSPDEPQKNIISETNFSNSPDEKPISNQENPQVQKLNDKSEDCNSLEIEAQNNDAVQSIIAAAQINDPALNVQLIPNKPTEANPEVVVYDGCLDSYLKTSGITNPANTNPVYINTGGGLIMMPQDVASKQYFIVNNQPIVNVPTLKTLTEGDILAMPTIIVSEDVMQPYTATTAPKKVRNTRNKEAKILPKPTVSDVTSEFLTFSKTTENTKPYAKITITKVEPVQNDSKTVPTSFGPLSTDIVPASTAVPLLMTVTENPVTSATSPISVTCTSTSSLQPTFSNVTPISATIKAPTPRSGSHIRNLNFSTPEKPKTTIPLPEKSNDVTVTTDIVKKTTKSWDSDLRSLALTTSQPLRCPTPKRKRPATTRAKKKIKGKTNFEEKLDSEKDNKDENKTVTEEESGENKQNDVIVEVSIPEPPDAKVSPILNTPIKEIIPKTPGGDVNFETFHGTPFNDVLEEHIRGLDLISLPTPKLPITPGFSLTPYDAYNRPTDYSTSSSYYQPSDTEQCKSIGQLIEECEKDREPKNEGKQSEERFENLRILSDAIDEKLKCEMQETQSVSPAKTKPSGKLKSFNENVIGRKNLSLLKGDSNSSSSDSTDSESDKFEEVSNKTVICKSVNKSVDKIEINAISNIINTVEVKPTLTKKEIDREAIKSKLEEIRQRTVKKIKNQSPIKKPRAKRQPKPKPKPPQKKTPVRRRKKTEVEDNCTNEADDLVKGLAQRGIHLIPNKKLPENNQIEKNDISKTKKSVDLPDISAAPHILPGTKLFQRNVITSNLISKQSEFSGLSKKLSDYNLQVLTKKIQATVFVERLNQDMNTTMSCTPFETLINLSFNKTDSSDDLMDFAISLDHKSEAHKQSIKGTKRRRAKLIENDTNSLDKKCKSVVSNLKLLSRIDVDTFLDKVHGE